MGGIKLKVSLMTSFINLLHARVGV